MKKIFYILLLTSQFALAKQPSKIDSLLKQIKPTSGIARADTYNKLGWEFRNSSLQMTDSFANLAIQLSASIGYDKGIGQGYNNLALVDRSNGDYAAALDKARWALLKFVKAHDREGYSSVYNTIASLHHLQGNYSVALFYYFQSLKISESLHDNNGIARTLNNIGVIYLERGSYQRALMHFFKSYLILRQYNTENELADELNNIGNVYQETNEKEKAASYYLRSIEINVRNNDIKSVVAGYINVGSVYAEMGDLKKALEYYFQAQNYNEKAGDMESMVLCKNNLADLYLQMNMMHTALKYAMEALDLALEHHMKAEIVYAYKILFQIEVKSGHFKEALNYHELYTQYNDSISNEATSRKINYLENEFAKAKSETDSIIRSKDREISARMTIEKEKRISEYIFIIGLILALFIILIYVVFFILKWQKTNP